MTDKVKAQYSQPIPELTTQPKPTVEHTRDLQLEINKLINLTEHQTRQIRRLESELAQLREYLRKNTI